MEILNMTPYDVNQVSQLIEELKVDNSDLVTRMFPMPVPEAEQPDKPDLPSRILDLETAVNALIYKVDRIFANHILIDGRFKEIR